MSYYDRDKYPNRNDLVDQDTTNQMARMHHWPKSHIGNSAEFMVSGWPYFQSGGSFTASLPTVSSWICISAIGDDVTVTLQGGSASFIVPAGTTTGQLDLKCTSVTCVAANAGTASLSAGLTNVHSRDFPDISTTAGVV